MIAALRERRLEPEVMDDPSLDPDHHRHALHSLARINTISRSAKALWEPLRRFHDEQAGRPLRVLDIACGGGDLPAELNRRAKAEGRDLIVDGCDISPIALEVATETHRAVEGVDARFFQLDAVRDALPEGYDVMISSMFTHHIERAEVTALLAKMAAASRFVIINDLVRSWYGLLGVSVVVHLVSRSPVVHVDGPRSIRAAFTPTEMQEMADAANLVGAKIQWQPPIRMVLTWEQP